MIEASGLPHVVHAGRSVWSPLRSQLARLPVDPDAPDESSTEHHEILEALARQAPRRARAAAERHARLSGTRLFSRLPGASARGLVHQALVYRSDQEFADAATAFVNDGLDAGERVLAVTTEHNSELLGQALGGRSDEIEFRDSREWYRVPSHALLAYHRYVAHADSDRVRIIGEPVWSTLSPGAVTEWTRYESLLNVELALAPASILRPYDAAALAEPIVKSAARTHPEVSTAGGTRASGHYHAPAASATRSTAARSTSRPDASRSTPSRPTSPASGSSRSPRRTRRALRRSGSSMRCSPCRRWRPTRSSTVQARARCGAGYRMTSSSTRSATPGRGSPTRSSPT